jgi:putative Mn2+ efflux pump MntP
MSLLLLAVALSMDVFAAALSRGVTAAPGDGQRTALSVGLAVGVAHGLMPLVGWSLTSAMAAVMRDVDHWVAFALLVLIGVRMLSEARRPDDEEKPAANGNTSLAAVALATSIDAAVAGGTFAALGQSVIAGCAVLALTAFLFAVAGVYLGRRAGDAVGAGAQVLGGLVLIGLGIKIVIAHEFFGG